MMMAAWHKYHGLIEYAKHVMGRGILFDVHKQVIIGIVHSIYGFSEGDKSGLSIRVTAPASSSATSSPNLNSTTASTT